MEHTGYIRIERKKIPFYLKDKKVHLIPDNPFASLMPGNIKEKEIVKGTTTDNREIIFIGCRYNSCILIYKALIISTILDERAILQAILICLLYNSFISVII